MSLPEEGLANGDDTFTGKACRGDMRGRHQGNKVQLLEQTGLKVHREDLDGVTSRFVSFSSEMKMVRMSL